MAVVTINGAQAVDKIETVSSGDTQAPTQLAAATVKKWEDNAVITSGDSANSLVKLAKLPSNSVISAQATLYHDGITSLNDFDIGVYDNDFNVKDADCLADGLDLSSAGSKVILAGVAIENRYKKLWELAGYTADPGGLLYIVGTLKAAAGATGDAAWEITYSDGAN